MSIALRGFGAWSNAGPLWLRLLCNLPALARGSLASYFPAKDMNISLPEIETDTNRLFSIRIHRTRGRHGTLNRGLIVNLNLIVVELYSCHWAKIEVDLTAGTQRQVVEP